MAGADRKPVLSLRGGWSGGLFVAPYLVVFVLMLVVPLVIGIRLSLTRGDLFVVPSWQQHAHHSNGGAVLFRATDEPVMKKLGFMRDAGAAQ